MILFRSAAAPTHSPAKVPLATLAAADVAPAGDYGRFRLATADPPYSAYAARQTLPVHPTLRLPAPGARQTLPAHQTLRFSASTGYARARFVLFSSVAAPLRTHAKIALAGLSVAGIAPTGSEGRYLRVLGTLYEPPPPPAPLPIRSLNFSDTSPAAPANALNLRWQADSGTNPRNVSAFLPLMVGDTGSGGAVGLVPAPLAGAYAASMFLRADGHWAIPPTPQGNFVVEVNAVQIASTANAGTAFTILVNGNAVANYSS